MHGDKCHFCKPAMDKVQAIAQDLHCMQDSSDCELHFSEEYSHPILLQHFPLFRKNDEECHGNDPDLLENPKDKQKPFQPTWDCLSQESSNFLLNNIRPRLVLSGHTHNGCRKLHGLPDGRKIPEWSVASFSWRNRNNPVIVMATLTPDEFVLDKCFLPHESTVINMYIFGLVCIGVYAILTRRKFFRRF